MIDLEDLPRMQSLSPVKEMEDYNITSTKLDPKKAPKMCRLLIKPTVASTPAKLSTPSTPTTPITPTTTIISDSLETPNVQRNTIFGFNYNSLVSFKLIF
ncbi:hypothetical protein KR044_010492 [Drosophila immigrans]|nr:hypothetical protein KR044_010492 [Drosophila immigrans]